MLIVKLCSSTNLLSTPAWLHKGEGRITSPQNAVAYRTLTVWQSLGSRPYSQSPVAHLCVSKTESALFVAGSAGIKEIGVKMERKKKQNKPPHMLCRKELEMNRTERKLRRDSLV